MAASPAFLSSRSLFLAAWVCPTFCLIGGGLPQERIAAAVLAATISGVIAAALPVRGFRFARLMTALVFPLVWLWLAYVALDGMGPSSSDTIAVVSNTYVAEAMTALRLSVTPKSVAFGLLALGLLAASYWRGVPPASRHSRLLLAGSMLLLSLIVWTPKILIRPPAFLPGRDDLQNFPYGSMFDILAGLADGYAARVPRQAIHRKPSEARVADSVDSIFILGETFRFSTLSELTSEDPPASSLGERFKSGLGVFLPKVCASADYTAASVPMLLTGTSPQYHDEARTAPSGLARLASAGYETAWISNQDQLDFFADEERDLVWIAKGIANQYDESLLPVASTVLRRKHVRNKALLLHFMDSHAAYEDRYPSMSEPDAINEEQRDQLRYRRANGHTLHVLKQIAELLDGVSTPTFAIYVSDHGENLLADHNGLRFHGSARTTVEAAYVPAIVLWNDAFRRKYNPNDRLQKLLAAPVLAHADLYRVWMNLSGLQADLTPTPQPTILGKVRITDPAGAVPCAALLP